MYLQPLQYEGAVSATQFGRLFRQRLGSLYGRALAVLHAAGGLHSFSVANCFELALQKGQASEMLAWLERWADAARRTTTARRSDAALASQFDGDSVVHFEDTYAMFFAGDHIAGVLIAPVTELALNEGRPADQLASQTSPR